MPTYTTTYSLGKPVVGADEDAWGDTLNASLDSIDDILDGTTPITGIDINSGTLDGVTIGGTTAGAGTFTTLTVDTDTLHVDSTNNRVGIGTSSPAHKLHVADATTPEIIVEDTTNNVKAVLGADNSVGRIGTDTNHPVTFRTNDTERMRIKSDGNVQLNGQLHFTDTGSLIARPTTNALSFNTNGSEAMRIDSSGNVGIGTSSPNNYSANHRSITLNAPTTPLVDLEVNGTRTGSFVANSTNVDLNAVTSVPIRFLTADTERMRITSGGTLQIAGGGNDNVGEINMGNTAQNANRFQVRHQSSAWYLKTVDSEPIAFGTANSERMRINSSGTVLVGQTTASTSAAGNIFTQTGKAYHIVTGDTPLFVDRKSDDGQLVEFRRDQTVVGSIGTTSGKLYIENGDTGLRFENANNIIHPSGTNGGDRDAATDLGSSSVRFKDLYLSGGVYLGGTGSANKLDDYEQGTFQATLSAPTSGTITISSTADTLAYVKVGRLVTITGMVSIVSTGSAVGDFVLLNNLPFTSADRDEFSGRNGGAVTFNDNSAGTKTTKAILMLESSTQIRIYVDASTVGGSDDFYLSFSYQATT